MQWLHRHSSIYGEDAAFLVQASGGGCASLGWRLELIFCLWPVCLRHHVSNNCADWHVPSFFDHGQVSHWMYIIHLRPNSCFIIPCHHVFPVGTYWDPQRTERIFKGEKIVEAMATEFPCLARLQHFEFCNQDFQYNAKASRTPSPTRSSSQTSVGKRQCSALKAAELSSDGSVADLLDQGSMCSGKWDIVSKSQGAVGTAGGASRIT